jgi:hypothetical protein
MWVAAHVRAAAGVAHRLGADPDLGRDGGGHVTALQGVIERRSAEDLAGIDEMDLQVVDRGICAETLLDDVRRAEFAPRSSAVACKPVSQFRRSHLLGPFMSAALRCARRYGSCRPRG